MKNVLLGALLIMSSAVMAQNEELNGPVNVPSEGIIDGVYIKEHVPTKRMIPYEHVREADVIWSTRVWRSIDLREKLNHPLYYPLDDIVASYDTVPEVWVKNESRWSLWTVIRQHVMNGDLTIFSPFDPVLDGTGRGLDGDQFKYPIKPAP